MLTLLNPPKFVPTTSPEVLCSSVFIVFFTSDAQALFHNANGNTCPWLHCSISLCGMKVKKTFKADEGITMQQW